MIDLSSFLFTLQKDLELELGHVVNSEFLYSLSTKTKQINRVYLENRSFLELG